MEIKHWLEALTVYIDAVSWTYVCFYFPMFVFLVIFCFEHLHF